MLCRVALSVAVLLGADCLRLVGQSGDAPYIIRDNVNLVLLDVSARDPHAGYVTGLEQKNFTIYDDGVRQKVTQFSPTDAPVTVGLVVDNSGSMERKRREVVMAGLQFAKSSNHRDEFFVVNFNDRVYFGLPRPVDFTDQLQTLREALFFGAAAGQTALYDAIAVGLKHLEVGHRDIRTLIVVSDGGDNVSKIAFPEVTHLIDESRAMIYTIGLLDPEDRDLNPKVLRKIAAISGGEYFAPNNVEELEGIFEKIAKDLRNRYSMAFVPDRSVDMRTVHALKVEARDDRGQKLMVRSRTAYVSAQ
jgi:Ca-activated chloride channel family protein